MKHLIDKIEQICNNISQITFDGKQKTKFIATENIAFTLLDEYAILYEELISDILSEADNSEKFSEKYIDKKLQSFIAILIKEKADRNIIEKNLKIFLNELQNFNTKYRVIVPLIGIQMTPDVFSAGEIRLLKGTQSTLDTIFSEVKEIILSTRNTDEEKEMMIKSQEAEFKQNLLNKVLADYSVVAEPTMAKDRAIIETRRVIDVFRFSIPFLYHDSHRVNLSIFGELSKQVRYIPILSEDKKGFTIESDAVGLLYNYELSAQNIEVLEKIGALKILDLLKRKFISLNDFEKVLLRTIHWYATHTIQEELENKLLNLITSLETLLTPRDNNPIGTAIAEGTAILVTEGVDNRRKLKKRMQELYRLRSAVSHGGKKSVNETDIIELRWIVSNLIVTLIHKLSEFNSQKDLLDWIEEQKLS